MQRTAILARGDLRLRPARLSQRRLGHHRRVTLQPPVSGLDTRK